MVIKATIVPILPPGGVDIQIGQDLHDVPGRLVELAHTQEGLCIVAQDELEVEDSLHKGSDGVEDDDLSPGGQEAEQRHHPDPVGDDSQPLVPAPLQAVRVQQDLDTAKHHHHGHKREVLDTDEEVG